MVGMTAPKLIFLESNEKKDQWVGGLSTLIHNFKWQLTFNESVMTGHCRKPQAHMSQSAHWPCWLICLSTVYSRYKQSASENNCFPWVGQQWGFIAGSYFAFYLLCAISWYLISSQSHVEQCWSPTVYETIRRYSLTLSFCHILHLYSLTTSSL